MQACGTQASAALDFRLPGRPQPCCMSLIMNKRELFGPSPQVAHGFQYVNEVSYNQQHAECKWVGDKRSKILGKLLNIVITLPRISDPSLLTC